MKFRGRVLDKWAKLPRTFVFIARDQHHGTFFRALSRADIGSRACHKKENLQCHANCKHVAPNH